jgi:ABC-2 type transport system permease protein
MEKLIAMFRREFWILVVIHFKELIREPGVLFWGVGFPVLMAWGLGMAFTGRQETRNDVGILNLSNDSHLMQFIGHYAKPVLTSDSLEAYSLSVNDEVYGNTVFRFIPSTVENAELAIKRGVYNLILEEKHDSVFYHLDPANPEARLQQLQLSILFSAKNIPGNLSFSNVNIKPLQLKGTRYIDFLIPGLVGMGVMMACMWGISYTIIERRKGLMIRRMIATPMRKYNLLMAHMTARVTINFIEAALLIVFAHLFFGTTIQGSLIALFLVLFAGNMAFTGIAVLFSSRTSKTEIGNAVINVVVMPMMLLSGVFFSYQNFPEWSIGFIEKLPLTLLANGVRSIFNEGVGLMDVLPNIAILTFTGVLTFIVGLKIFKWY